MDIVMVLLLGAAIGSFLNVVILRLPEEDQSIVFPGSHCPGCQHAIAWFDNIPILSFLLLRGRCRHCGVAISWQYPLVEMAMACLTLALYVRFGVSPAFLIYFPFLAALLAIIFIDIRHYIIPDVISLPGIVIGLAASFVSPQVTPQDAVIGLLAGGGLLWGIAMAYAWLKKIDGMGGGDIKLLGMIGAFLGWQSLPFVIFASSLVGTLAGTAVWIVARIKRQPDTAFGRTKIPFGPFLAIAAMVYLFFDHAILVFIARLTAPG